MVETITFTTQQLKIMAILPMTSAPLSLLGSSLIVLKIFRERKKRASQTYHRILLGFSIIDIVGSIAYCFSTLPSPVGTPDVWGANGNDSTCTAQGFFLVTGLGIVYYNAALMIYYVLKIRYNVSEVTLRKHYDPWVHRFVLFFSFLPSVLGAIFGMINNIGNVCFIGDHPKGCASNEEVECERGQKYFMFSMITMGIVVIIATVTVPICMLLISLKVQKEDDAMKKYEFRSKECVHSSSHINNSSILQRSQSLRGKASCKIKQVRTQALMYAVTSVLCLWWPIILRFNAAGGLFTLRCLAQFFYPMLGFFNFINYTRPRMMKLVESGTAQSKLHALYLATFVSEDELRRLNLQKKTQLAAKRDVKHDATVDECNEL